MRLSRPPAAVGRRVAFTERVRHGRGRDRRTEGDRHPPAEEQRREDQRRGAGEQPGGRGEHAPALAHLSYADLAVAVVDGIESPCHHRTRVSIFGDVPD
ncbi:hypothetical protein O7622_17470 [Micromonospora sp. WMMD1076]|uniref:hypothetical protein n=1 Tax=Micromonospora TaxID=1873 RepID=UPI00249C6D09|nr:hypothetical protein [Micromonospora sp. WMMD1076]WFF04857.1 hypothetical protein O7622_17470 [Micromonospora sp. WMMD1076]